MDDGERYYLFLFFLFLYFSRGGRPSSSTCCYGFVCEGVKKSCLVDELDKLLWTTIRTVVVLHFCSSTLPLGVVTSVQTGDPGGGGRSTRHSAGTMGHGPFHCIAPCSDLSGAHGCCLHGHRHPSRLPVCRTPPRSQPRHIS